MINEKLFELGISNVGEVLTEDIPFQPALLEMCEMNRCGLYGKNYGCPPHVGKPDELINKAKGYKKAIVFQKIYPLEDSFDFEGMVNGKNDFKEVVYKVFDLCKEELKDFLLLGAGGCTRCETCGAIDGTPCRFPDLVIPSLESYCVQVSTLAPLAGMKYINGQNTVTYFGAVLCD